MSQTNDIEIFEGSIRYLEELTQESFKVIRSDSGRLLKVRTELSSKTIEQAENRLREKANEVGADALVNVKHRTIRVNGSDVIFGVGYAVKKLRPTWNYIDHTRSEPKEILIEGYESRSSSDDIDGDRSANFSPWF